MTLKSAIRWLFALLLIIALLVLVLGAALPLLVQYGTRYWFQQQGLQVSINDVSFDITNANTHIHGLQAKRNDTVALQLDTLSLQWSWRQLFDHTAHFQYLLVEGLQLNTRQTEDGRLIVAGIDLSTLKGAGKDTNPTPGTPAWRLQLDRLQLRDTRLCYRTQLDKSLDYCLRLGKLDWHGGIDFDLSAQVPAQALQASGSLQLTDLQAYNNTLQRDLLRIQKASLDRLELDTLDTISLQQLRLDQFELMRRDSDMPARYINTVEHLLVNQLDLQNLSNLMVTRIDISQHGAAIIKQADSSYEFQQWLPEQENTDYTDESAVDKTTTGFSFQIDELLYHSNKALLYIDRSFDKPFRVSLNKNKLRLVNLSNQHPDRPVELNYQGQYNRHGRLAVSGKLWPFDTKVSFDMQGRLSGIDLREFSAFTRRAISHTIQHGQLDAELILRAKHSQLNSEIDLKLYHFALKALSAHDAEKLDASFGFPLNTSLALLKDRDDVIRLHIPASGELDKPDFDLYDAINKALSKAVTAAVISYYTPYGLVLAADSLISLATALRFEPVVFTPGSTELDEAARSALTALVELMNERPGIHLTLCAISQQADRLALHPDIREADTDAVKPDDRQQQALLDLANQRAQAVKQYLVDNGVDASRLILCTPQYDDSAEQAVVEISI